MAQHNTLGKTGEDEAVRYLESKGYCILHRNWRKSHLELDIVATKDNELIIIEVKTRTNTSYILPQEAVTRQKVRHTVIAADAYLKTYRMDIPVRFDIITVVGREGCFKIEHIKEAFFPPMF